MAHATATAPRWLRLTYLVAPIVCLTFLLVMTTLALWTRELAAAVTFGGALTLLLAAASWLAWLGFAEERHTSPAMTDRYRALLRQLPGPDDRVRWNVRDSTTTIIPVHQRGTAGILRRGYVRLDRQELFQAAADGGGPVVYERFWLHSRHSIVTRRVSAFRIGTLPNGMPIPGPLPCRTTGWWERVKAFHTLIRTGIATASVDELDSLLADLAAADIR
ncbi:hypothetical protein [Amycolatopsis anabasis]|uniref:hypothetical protein n=1 Tax=Amycolatopsis anabasis TaxID=1840409 RepID=UPI00131B959D|nr:hypothetical protein [Amycolatopsis anabasis]